MSAVWSGKKFGTADNYPVAVKHNSMFKGLLKLLLSNLLYAIDGSRTFVLYFDDTGIYEKELSLTDDVPFLLIPWREVYDFGYKDKGNKVCLNVDHLGKPIPTKFRLIIICSKEIGNA